MRRLMRRNNYFTFNKAEKSKMKRFAVLASIIGLSVALLLSDAFGWDSEYRQGFALSKSVEKSHLIVKGRVTALEGVFRENISGKITTDVTVTVTERIKGTPNINNNKVKFMIRGGRAVDPATGKTKRLIDTSAPKFRINDEVLLFMVNSTDSYYANYPYNQLSFYRGRYGKKPIKDNKVSLLYAMEDDKLKSIRVPIDLTVQLAKAAIKDKDAMIELEAELKKAITQRTGTDTNLSQTLVDSLTTRVEAILDKDTDTDD